MSDQTGAEDLLRLAADIQHMGVRATVQADRALRKAVTDIQARAQVNAPVDTGYLRSSISSEVQSTGGTIRGEVGPTANYGGYVENGTSTQRAQPYLRPATDAVVPGYEAALEQIGEF